MSRDLSRLLHPKSIAVFGGKWAENVILQCEKIGFSGDIWPVHPTREEFAGQPCFRSVADLPRPPDAAFVGVNRHATLDVVTELSAANCGGAISFASGFKEAGGDGLQTELLERAGDMPVLGPNCYGLINCLDGAVIWPDQHGCTRVDRGVAILSQSSNIGITLTMQRRSLPVAYLACVGNAAQTGLAELADAFLGDPRVTALGVFMEGVGNAVAFAEVVARARTAGKGVVVLKAGQSMGGQAAVMSHTAALAGEGVASSAYLEQIGAGEVKTIPELIEALKILHTHGPLDARRYISVSCSGGEAGLVADAAEDSRLEFPPVPNAQSKQLSDFLGPLVTISNPLDYHTFIWGDGPKMTDVFTAALDGFDAGLFVIDPPRADTCDTADFRPAFLAFEQTAQRTGKPAFAVATLPETIDEDLAARFLSNGVVPLLGLPEALAALSAATVAEPQSDWAPWPVSESEAGKLFTENAAKQLLAAAKISVPKSAVAVDIGSLDVTGLKPPFALKGLGVAHKSELGAVRLNVTDPGTEPDMTGVTGYMLEEMVNDAIAEVLIGARRDPVYGATMTLGLGGVATELLRDTVTLVLPVTDQEIDVALRKL
ncbi:MAG: acetate--CoA ligase family protein, partial [Boseongicola sp.]